MLSDSKKSVETMKSTRIMVAVLATALAIDRCIDLTADRNKFYLLVLAWGFLASFLSAAAMYRKIGGVTFIGRVTLVLNIGVLVSLWPVNYQISSLFILVQFWFIPAFFPIGPQYQLINPELWREAKSPTREQAWRLRFGSAALNLNFGLIFLFSLCLGALWQDSKIVCLILIWGIALRHLVYLGLWSQFYQENRKWFYFLLALSLAPLTTFLLWGMQLAIGLDLILSLFFLRFLLRGHPASSQLAKTFSGSPAVYILASFAGLSALGAVLLSLPISQATGQSISVLDAMFTAVSAVCVTGLATVDPSRSLSGIGQFVLLALIQVGGLGIMVFSTFFAVSMGESLGIRREKAIGQIVDQSSVIDTYSLIRFIVISTFMIEAFGAAVLTWRFYTHNMSFASALWKGIFHSISAFCNAGFALQVDSLVSFQADAVLISTVSILIVLGGLGFGVMSSLSYYFLGRRRRLDLHSRIVLVMTAGLLLVGLLFPLCIEWSHALKDLPFHSKLINSFFYSASLRTAGFNSVDMQLYQPGTLLISMVLMFIGGAPGGTAGGIKVTTLMVLFASLSSHVQQKPHVHVFRKQFYRDDIDKSIVVLTFSAFTVLVISFGLLLTQEGSFQALCFEAVSAVGTVGLSLGLTPHLDAVGKVLVIFGMLLGRVGPLTFLFAFDWRGNTRVSFPREKVQIG